MAWNAKCKHPGLTEGCEACRRYSTDSALRALWDAQAEGKANPPPVAPALVPSAEGPPWWRKALNFAGAAIAHVWAGLPETPTPEQERRVALCLACPLIDAARGVCRHPKCGCPVQNKARWADQGCPLGKW